MAKEWLNGSLQTLCKTAALSSVVVDAELVRLD